MSAQHTPDATVISWDISERGLTDGSSTFDVVGTSGECRVTFYCVDERTAEALCGLLNSNSIPGAVAEKLCHGAAPTDKRCTRCSEQWPADIEFFRPQPKPRQPNRLAPWCRACEAEQKAHARMAAHAAIAKATGERIVTYATTGTSVRRNLPYLLPAERAVFEPTEAELIAADRSRALAKDNGTLERLEAYWANLDQVRADSMSGGSVMKRLGTFQSKRWGTVVVSQAHYLFANGPICIHLDTADGEPLTKLSVNMYRPECSHDSADLPADCFYVKQWSENETLAEEAMASGLFRARPDLGVATSGFVETPVWQVVTDGAAS